MAGRIYVEELHPGCQAWLELEPPTDWVLFIHPDLSPEKRRWLTDVMLAQVDDVLTEPGACVTKRCTIPMMREAGAF